MQSLFQDLRLNGEPSLDACIAVLGETLPWLQGFKDTPQDPEWHAEGDVHIHTEMVLQETYALLRGPAAHVQGERRLQLVLGALLHDLAKPPLTREALVRGVPRVVAPGHEAAGRSAVAQQLAGAGLHPHTLETVMGLVGYHHEPKSLVRRKREAPDYHRVARVVCPALLYWLERADIQGRICPAQDVELEHVEMFRLLAEEAEASCRLSDAWPEWVERLRETFDGCAQSVLDRIVGEARRELEAGLIRSPEEAIARSYTRRRSGAELVVMVGPSGTGKTTFVGEHLGDHDVISLDRIREEITGDRGRQDRNTEVVREGHARLQRSLGAKRRVVWDATSLRREFRDKITRLAWKYEALVSVVVMQMPAAVFQRRNRERDGAVAPAVLASQQRDLEWPELTEAHRTVVLDANLKCTWQQGCTGVLPYGLDFADI